MRQLEVLYGTRDVLRRRQLVRDALGVVPGERIMDVGCGPGFYVAELLEHVGSDGSVVGIDSSQPMLAVAAHRSEGHDNVSFHEADATSLPVEDASFDAALSVQVLEYVADVPAALAEMYRALRAGGRLVVWDVDWATVSLHTTDLARTERILRAWDGHLAHPSLPQTLTAQLQAAGFDDVKLEGHTFATNGSIRTHMAASSSPSSHSSWSGGTGSQKTRRTHGKPSSGSWRSATSSSSPASSSASPRRAPSRALRT